MMKGIYTNVSQTFNNGLVAESSTLSSLVHCKEIVLHAKDNEYFLKFSVPQFIPPGVPELLATVF